MMHVDRVGKPINASVDLPFKKKVKKTLFKDWGPGLKAYIVRGKSVREGYDIDFTEGGNYGKYAFVPKNEIWLDDRQGKDEIFPTLLHELLEYKMIASGDNYNPAHVKASKEELKARIHPREIKIKVDEAAVSLLKLLGFKKE